MTPYPLPVLFVMIMLGTVSTFWPGPKAQSQAWTQSDIERDGFKRAYPVHTFEERWWPGEGLPVEQPKPYSDYPLIKVVKTVRITPPLPEPPVMQPEIRTAVWHEPAEIPARVTRPAVKPRPTRVADICARHGMRRVDYGKRWRCRR
jgi:hypothetical protein